MIYKSKNTKANTIVKCALDTPNWT